jgi:DmsE family decaheme c-type cytochrome
MLSTSRLRAFCSAWLLLFAALAALRQDPQDPTAPFPRAGDYAGNSRCIECHEQRRDLLLAGHHGAILGAAGLDGCETCHGPGKAHSDDPNNDPAKITLPTSLGKERQVAFCGRCHREQAAHHRGDLAGFLAAGKSCTDCHVVHKKPAPAPSPGVQFHARSDTAAAAAVGADACVVCHPLRDALLQRSAHGKLAAGSDQHGCETCHGNGGLHRPRGVGRLITRPDQATDGVATCRSCHPQVDAELFHWRDRRSPLLSQGATCTTCHRVHEDRAASAATAVATTATATPTNAVCARCHAPAMCVLPGSIHASLGHLDGPLEPGCASCHPGAAAHAAGPGKKALVESLHAATAALQAKVCKQCHGSETALRHLQEGSHQRRDVGCLACHSVAAVPGKVADDAEQKCGRCHAEVDAQFRQPNHHPVPEGRMHCSSCHDVHGARFKLHDLELKEGRCVGCHSAYRGPFVFTHQVTRRDGCVACHVAHGSSNKRMLQEATTQQNCTACHGDFPAFHDQTLGSVYTNCLRCHTEVHGSNHSRFLFR